ncbi:MAG: protein translocase subunit SecD [Anaerolineae bacterium]
MDNRFRYTLIAIVVLALIALWVVWPSNPGVNFSLGPLNFNKDIRVHEGLDLQGGLQVLLQAKTIDANGNQVPPAPADLDATRFIIENRVNGLGVSEPIVQIQGDDKIIVELPGLSDPDQAIKTFGQTGRLEFIDAGDTYLQPGTKVQTSYPDLWPIAADKLKVAATSALSGTSAVGATGAVTNTGAVSDTTTAGTKFATVVTGEHLASAELGSNQTTGEPVVNFALTSDGSKRFLDYTSKNVGKYLAIVLDGQVISSPRVNSAISDSGQITGNFTQETANSLVLQLKYGALKVPLEVVDTRVIGPSLGQDSVQRSLLAGFVGLLAVALFMMIYYRLPGIMATLALLIYGAIVFALFKLIPVTLTLAGITGFILSIGMAVDANVLIFERMREELRNGKRLRGSIEDGFRRAWPSIRDSNISTLLTCAVLFWFGSQFGASIVKGFALTLAIGVLVSMFTAIVVTRTFLRLTRRFWDIDENTPEATARLQRLFGF